MRQLFAEAIELSPDDREAFLRRARESQENEEVLKEVESLLAFHRESDRPGHES